MEGILVLMLSRDGGPRTEGGDDALAVLLVYDAFKDIEEDDEDEEEA